MPRGDEKFLKTIPKEIIREYELDTESLKDVTVTDVNNIAEALSHMAKKGNTPRGLMCTTGMCTTGMCTTAAAVKNPIKNG